MNRYIKGVALRQVRITNPKLYHATIGTEDLGEISVKGHRVVTTAKGGAVVRAVDGMVGENEFEGVERERELVASVNVLLKGRKDGAARRK